MRSIACPLCGEDTARVVVRTDFNLTGATPAVYQVVECQDCRFRYLNPRPGPEALAEYYAADYPAHTLRPMSEGVDAEQASVNRRFGRVVEHRLALVERFAGSARGLQRVLDVGCGNGAFLQGVLNRGKADAWGLDVSAAALARAAHLDTRLKLVMGDLHTADLPRGYFDLVTLWHCLEHDGNPVGALERACELLRPGGTLVAEVPNSGGLIARLCGRHWLGWDLPRHLVHFGAGSLRRTACRAGLAGVRVLRQYTLNPLCLSPLLASLELWRRRWRRKRIRRIAYRRWDGVGNIVLRLVNGMECLLGGNGLLLVARAPQEGDSRCTA